MIHDDSSLVVSVILETQYSKALAYMLRHCFGDNGSSNITETTYLDTQVLEMSYIELLYSGGYGDIP